MLVVKSRFERDRRCESDRRSFDVNFYWISLFDQNAWGALNFFLGILNLSFFGNEPIFSCKICDEEPFGVLGA